MSEKKHILLFYIARTSSSYIWQLFKGFPDVHVYGEILNGSEKYLKPLNASEKLSIDDDTESYRTFAKKNLESYIQFLGSQAPEDYFFTKISLVHISSLIKKKSTKLLNILKNPNTKVIVLQRNLIDTYTSLKKVKVTESWRECDTTDIQIDIDCDDFLNYYERMTLLYSNLFEILMDLEKGYLLIDYDELHSKSSDYMKALYLQENLSKIDVNIDLNRDRFEKLKLMYRQDRNTNKGDKIKNYKGFVKFLLKNNLNHLVF